LALGALTAFFIGGNTMQEQATNRKPCNNFADIIYAGLQRGSLEEAEALEQTLRQLNGVLTNMIITADNDMLVIDDSMVVDLLTLSEALATKALGQSKTLQEGISHCAQELTERAENLPGENDLWVKIKLVGEQQMNTRMRMKAIAALMSTLEPVILVHEDESETTLKIAQLKIMQGGKDVTNRAKAGYTEMEVSS
jgi:hypothetical protein